MAKLYGPEELQRNKSINLRYGKLFLEPWHLIQYRDQATGRMTGAPIPSRCNNGISPLRRRVQTGFVVHPASRPMATTVISIKIITEFKNCIILPKMSQQTPEHHSSAACRVIHVLMPAEYYLWGSRGFQNMQGQLPWKSLL